MASLPISPQHILFMKTSIIMALLAISIPLAATGRLASANLVTNAGTHPRNRLTLS